MLRGLQGSILAAAAATTLAGSAAGGLYSPPPGDTRPVWSPDGSVIVYATVRAPQGLRVVRPDGTDDHPLPGFSPYATFAFSRDWFWIAFPDYEPTIAPGAGLFVSRPDGTGRRLLGASDGGRPSWAPDGRRIAFARPEPNEPSDVFTVGVDGSGLHQVAEDGFGPVFSPDGTRIAYVAERREPFRWDVAVVGADGVGRVVVTARLPAGAYALPAWSPDGTRLAFVGRGFVGVVRADGSGLRRLPPPGVTGWLEWSPDGRRILVSGGAMNAPDVGGVHVLDVASGRSSIVSPFGSGGTWSPDGTRIAFAGGGECKDRMGIYVATPDGRRERITHDCRVAGTEGPDALEGTTLADVVLGRGGADRLRARDDNYMGDDLYGGAGADVLEGGRLLNVLDGGPGGDRLDAGPGPDTLRGGPGPDALAGRGGRDVLFADDGARDAVSCGTNAPSGGRDLDAAFVDRRDRVAGDCELLYRDGRLDLRRGSTAFTITLSEGSPGKVVSRRRLRCNPPGGTLPRPAAACRRLATMRGALAPVAPGSLCAAGPQSFRRAQLEGRVGGVAVLLAFGRSTRCEVARWDRHAFLLGPAR